MLRQQMSTNAFYLLRLVIELLNSESRENLLFGKKPKTNSNSCQYQFVFDVQKSEFVKSRK